MRVDLDKLSDILGVPVVGATARNGQGIDELMKKLKYITSDIKHSELHLGGTVRKISYSDAVIKSAAVIEPVLFEICGQKINSHWLSLRLLDADESLINSVSDFIGFDIRMCDVINEKIDEARELYKKLSQTADIRDEMVSSIVTEAEKIAAEIVTVEDPSYSERDRKLDRILTGKFTGLPIMALLLALIFWITITGANYPSAFLSGILFRFEDILYDLYIKLSLPLWIGDLIIHGVYRVLAWVVSVMLPPMAIFFPLFTLLEDLGYLPRVAFNLDNCFKRCNACGKQALTLCMGFGCNSAGVMGCRIIDSPRERLIAVLTNALVPCNGRFPMIVSLITIFLVGTFTSGSSVISAIILSMFIMLSIFMTLLVSKILSSTILKGIPSSFTLELPPFRPPQIGKIIVRSIFDRTIFVLGRAVAVAAPAGAVIWLMANISVGDASLLTHCSSFLDPFGKFIGLDGVILMAFILGFPANEIVIPIVIMAYTAGGTLIEFDNLSALRHLLVNNGWTWITAVSTILFSLMHWPCSTTIITIKKETQSTKWTIAAFLIPTLCGIITCTIFSNIAKLLT